MSFLKFGDKTCPSFIFFLYILFYFLIFSFISISWRLIVLQYCSGFIHFKGVVLELLAPIYKKEKSIMYSCSFLSPGGVPHCSRWGCSQNFHLSFPVLVGLSLSLTDAGALLSPPGSTTEVGWRCIRGRPNSIPD